MSEKITWEVLVELEPRLQQVFDECAAVKDDQLAPWFCANRIWYNRFKPRIVQLVGFERADHPILGTPTAYNIAYNTCYHQLPYCRDCDCL